MSPLFEAFLAKIYVDDESRRRFLKNPRAEASRAGLTAAECDALEKIDRTRLELASNSFKLKRDGRQR
jgi:hypothetical protein